jgi:hypothetical protein
MSPIFRRETAPPPSTNLASKDWSILPMPVK